MILQAFSFQILHEEAGGTAAQIEDDPFYHGILSTDECQPLLVNPGDFLVRREEIDGETQYVITVLSEISNELTNFVIKRTRPVSNNYLIVLHHHLNILFSRKRTVLKDVNVRINFQKHLYYVHIYAFKTISDLIAFHSRMKKPLNEQNVRILKGIGRGDWQIAHEQVKIILCIIFEMCVLDEFASQKLLPNFTSCTFFFIFFKDYFRLYSGWKSFFLFFFFLFRMKVFCKEIYGFPLMLLNLFTFRLKCNHLILIFVLNFPPKKKKLNVF